MLYDQEGNVTHYSIEEFNSVVETFKKNRHADIENAVAHARAIERDAFHPREFLLGMTVGLLLAVLIFSAKKGFDEWVSPATQERSASSFHLLHETPNVIHLSPRSGLRSVGRTDSSSRTRGRAWLNSRARRDPLARIRYRGVDASCGTAHRLSSDVSLDLRPCRSSTRLADTILVRSLSGVTSLIW